MGFRAEKNGLHEEAVSVVMEMSIDFLEEPKALMSHGESVDLQLTHHTCLLML